MWLPRAWDDMEAQCGSSLEWPMGSWTDGQLEAHQGACLYLIERQSQSLNRGVTPSDSYSRKIILVVVVVWKWGWRWKTPSRKKWMVDVAIVQGIGDQSLNQNRAEKGNVFKKWFWNTIPLVTSPDDQLDISEDNWKGFSLKGCGWCFHKPRSGMQEKEALERWWSEGWEGTEEVSGERDWKKGYFGWEKWEHGSRMGKNEDGVGTKVESLFWR